MKHSNLFLAAFIFLISACTHRPAPGQLQRTPQSEVAPGCKKISEYHNHNAESYIKLFPIAQREQLKVLGTYSHKLKHQIAKLIAGINQESFSNSNPAALKLYKAYLGELIAQSAYVSAIYHQLNEANVYEMCRPFSHGEVVLDVTSFQQVIERAQILGKEKGLLVEMKDEWVDNLTKDIVKLLLREAAYEIHDAVIQNIAWNGIKAIARESAGGLARGVLVSATTGTLITVLTKPLKSGTIPEYNKWQTAIGRTPELYLNPEWMKKAGVTTIDPWVTHGLAFERNREVMKSLASNLYKKLDASFYARVSDIYLSTKNLESNTYSKQFHVEPAESTGVHTIKAHEDKVPFWMK